MKKFILLSILVLVSCNTTKNSQYRRDNRFPITIISGEVELQITGYNTNNNEIDGLAYFFADENTKAKLLEDVKETEILHYKEWILKQAGLINGKAHSKQPERL